MLRSCGGRRGGARTRDRERGRSARDKKRAVGGKNRADAASARRARCHFWVANARERPRATRRRVGARARERAPRVRSRVSTPSRSTHLGTLSRSSGRSSAITPALCMGSMFCGRVASSATVCTKATLSFWYFSNTWSTARVDAIVLDPRERARVRENPGHRRARNDPPSRGFLLPKPDSGELEVNVGRKGRKKRDRSKSGLGSVIPVSNRSGNIGQKPSSRDQTAELFL